MLFINALIVILIPLLLGLFVLSLLIGKTATKSSGPEKLALSFPLGLGITTLIMFIYGTFGIPLTFITVAGTILGLTIVTAIYAFKTGSFCLKKEQFTLKPDEFKPIEWLMVFLIGLKILYVYFIAIVKPMVDIDGFQQYTIVAKAIFFDRTFTLPYLNQFYGDKPLLPFLAQGWALLGLGTPNDALLKIIFPTLFLCFLIIFYSILKRNFKRLYALLFTFMLSTLPFIVYHVTTAYADCVITFYYAIATFYLFVFMKDDDKPALLLSFIFLAFAVWSKKAGVILAGINIVVLGAYLLANKRALTKAIVIPFIVFILIILPWVARGQFGTFTSVISSLHQVKTTQQITPSAPAESAVDKTAVILSTFGRKLFLYGDWHLTGGLLIISLLLFYKYAFRPPLIFLLAIILLDFIPLFVQFESGETFRWLLDGTLFDRLVMNEIPVILFFCAQAIIPGLTERSLASGNRASAKRGKGS